MTEHRFINFGDEHMVALSTFYQLASLSSTLGRAPVAELQELFTSVIAGGGYTVMADGNLSLAFAMWGKMNAISMARFRQGIHTPSRYDLSSGNTPVVVAMCAPLAPQHYGQLRDELLRQLGDETIHLVNGALGKLKATKD